MLLGGTLARYRMFWKLALTRPQLSAPRHCPGCPFLGCSPNPLACRLRKRDSPGCPQPSAKRATHSETQGQRCDCLRLNEVSVFLRLFRSLSWVSLGPVHQNRLAKGRPDAERKDLGDIVFELAPSLPWVRGALREDLTSLIPPQSRALRIQTPKSGCLLGATQGLGLRILQFLFWTVWSLVTAIQEPRGLSAFILVRAWQPQGPRPCFPAPHVPHRSLRPQISQWPSQGTPQIWPDS